MAASKKEQISQGALRAFAQNGYSETTMDTIAEAANVAKGTLYYHFKTKEELFLHVNQKGVEMLIDSVTGAMKDSTRSVSERMLYVLDEHLRFFAENRELCLLLLSISGDWQRDRLIGTVLSEYFATMEVYFRELQEEGIISPDLEVRTVASALFGMVGFTVLRKMFREEPVYTEETRSTLIRLCQGALGIKRMTEGENAHA
ncbi:TetR/AcrR family transcriptional regulator [Brevibacillus sp. SYP-B805]|uniref:TetR/AcrR family transcriptional regulator n=1 Tax=Brevibacillus sp. SYP-B805 TaxID=1578199 RepID=UPI0013EAE0D8|nr:TetR/AcrR family transcriptional regulator [Brevibacillus sp. SYP-B805]NGQ97087.1 TetR/AcrR family transcriptional regulator [Brevibacillus sp. SYP-B805]